ncbi:MAG TPA: beta-propeller fold lactonase family protein [Acidimicrobiales bacterium]|nr:beta-propeller fold lactonase family protein [Acidimicrobiales bacterium]
MRATTTTRNGRAAVLFIAAAALLAAACGSDSDGSGTKSSAATSSTVAGATTSPPTTVAGPPSDQTIMKRVDRITGNITPKSVTASPAGLVSAQSMMYSHNLTWYDPATRKLTATISDSVDLADFGIDGHPGTSQGAPVESTFTADGRYEYVSNYSMYGENFGPEGLDSCSAGDGTETSFVYRIAVATEKIDQVIQVGAVPKFMALTPDQRFLLVSNWCSWSLSVIDTAKGVEYKRIDLGGRYPRGVVASPDSKTAYVAMMGSNQVVSVNLATSDVALFSNTGAGPRHIVISPDGEFLYVTNNSSGTVTKVHRSSGEVVATHHTGDQPRSMDISSDGKALYVVNYDSSTVSKLRTSDLAEIDGAKTDYHPIGIAYEPTTKTVWVACYGGSLLVFSDTTDSGAAGPDTSGD